MIQEIITILLFAFLALLLSFVGGYVISAIVRKITGFFRTQTPSAAVMAQLNAGTLPYPGGAKAAPTAALSNIGLVALFVVGAFVTGVLVASFVIRPTPAVVVKTGGSGASSGAAAQPAAPTLPTSGDLTKIVAELPAGNPDRGKGLFTSQTCLACHSLEAGKVVVGPSLAGIFATAATREPGVGAKEYLYESIVSPNKFVVPKFQPDMMPPTFAQTMSAQQMADLLAWMEKDLK